MDTKATGSFDIKMTPQTDADHPAGRMTINKSYTGDLVGTGSGQMISKRTETGVAMYFAIEEFEGSLHDKLGGFTLMHQGKMSSQGSSLDITILAGSGYGDLKNISGNYTIVKNDEGHSYELDYQLEG